MPYQSIKLKTRTTQNTAYPHTPKVRIGNTSDARLSQRKEIAIPFIRPFDEGEKTKLTGMIKGFLLQEGKGSMKDQVA